MTRRMLAASGALALFVACIFTVLVLAIAGERETARLARGSAETTTAATELLKLVIDVQTGVRGFVIAGDERFLEPYQRARRVLPGQSRAVRLAVTADPRQRALAERIDGQIRSYLADYSVPLLATARRDRMAAIRVIARGEGKRRVDGLRYELALLTTGERSKAAARERQADAQADRAVALGLGGLAACVLLILLYALYLARSITEPVRAVAETISRLAGGDLGARVEEGGPQELRALASAFNSMAAAIEGGRRELRGQNVELEAQQVSLQHALGELAERKRRVEASQAFLERLAEHAEVAPLARTILDGLCELAGADIGTLFTVEGERDRVLFPLAQHGLGAAPDALSGDLAPRRRALSESRAIQLPAGDAEPSLRSSEGAIARRELHLPLRLGDRPVAVVTLGRLEDRAYTTGELRAIEHLVDQAAAALSNALLLDRTREQAAITRTVLEATPDAIGLFDRHARALLENAPMKRIRTEAGPDVVGAGLEHDLDEIAALDPIHTFQRYTAPVRDGSGDLMGRIVVLRDVTAEREADRLKDEFFALVSHELRTPLTSVLGYLELVCEDAGDRLGDEQRRFLEVAQRNARRLLRLVGDLLFVAQFEAGKLALELATVDIAAIAADAVEAAGPRARGREIALSLSAEPTPPSAGDADRLAQAFDNLISNAIKFNQASGRVDVRVWVRGDVAHAEFEDTGVGIPADEQELLFRRFFRATTATEHAIPGVGLGLTIVKAIVEGHGGQVDVRSERGAGTTFHVLLPLRTPPVDARPARKTTPKRTKEMTR